MNKKNIELKRLSSVNDFNKFRDGYEKAFRKRQTFARRCFELNQLKSFDYVYGIVVNGKLAAGFILNHEPKRCLESLDPIEKAHLLQNIIGNKSICELVGIWKSSEFRGAKITVMMWFHIMRKTFGMNRHYIFGCNRSEKVGSTYYYTVAPTFVKKATAPGQLEIFFYPRFLFIANFVANLIKFSFKNLTKPAEGKYAPRITKQPV